MGNQEENISSIPKTSLTDLKDKSRTKLPSISFFFLDKLCIRLVMILSCKSSKVSRTKAIISYSLTYI